MTLSVVPHHFFLGPLLTDNDWCRLGTPDKSWSFSYHSSTLVMVKPTILCILPVFNISALKTNVHLLPNIYLTHQITSVIYFTLVILMLCLIGVYYIKKINLGDSDYFNRCYL